MFIMEKVRDVYTLKKNNTLVMVASDRISAFDHVLPKGDSFQGASVKSNCFLLFKRPLLLFLTLAYFNS